MEVLVSSSPEELGVRPDIYDFEVARLTSYLSKTLAAAVGADHTTKDRAAIATLSGITTGRLPQSQRFRELSPLVNNQGMTRFLTSHGVMKESEIK